MATFAQLMANGVIAGCIYALAGLGLAVVYSTARFFHFAHGAVFAAGAYAAYVLGASLGLPLPAAIPMAVFLSTLLGYSMELLVYRPLRRRSASAMILLVASLGIYVLIQNAISMVFGDDTKIMRIGNVHEGAAIWGARITMTQMVIIGASAVLVTLSGILARSSRVGKAMRAVACDAELAAASGVNADRIISCAFAVGSALAGIAGILVAFERNLTPTMGMDALMMGVVAMIVGGAGSIAGVALGGILLGIAQNLGVWKIGSEWQSAVAFAVLLTFLLFRPHGIFARTAGKAQT